MSEILNSRRLIAPVLVMALGIVGCGRVKDDDHDYYIQSAPSPHEVSGAVADGKAFPDEAVVRFRDDSRATYRASPNALAAGGLVAVTAFCGNPVDKRDPDNLYVLMEVPSDIQFPGEETPSGTMVVTAAISDAEACADGVLTRDDRASL